MDEININTIIAIITNFALLVAIIIVLFKAIEGIKNLINRNKELNKTVNIILSKLDEKSIKCKLQIIYILWRYINSN